MGDYAIVECCDTGGVIGPTGPAGPAGENSCSIITYSFGGKADQGGKYLEPSGTNDESDENPSSKTRTPIIKDADIVSVGVYSENGALDTEMELFIDGVGQGAFLPLMVPDGSICYTFPTAIPVLCGQTLSVQGWTGNGTQPDRMSVRVVSENCDGGGGSGPMAMEVCPFVLEMRDIRTFPTNTPTIQQEGWDVRVSNHSGVPSPVTYNPSSKAITILEEGTYNIELTLVTSNEDATTPYNYVSLYLVDSFLAPTKFIMATHNTPNGADSIGVSSGHRTIVVRSFEIPYTIETLVIARENHGSLLELYGRPSFGLPVPEMVTNIRIKKVCGSTPAELNVRSS